MTSGSFKVVHKVVRHFFICETRGRKSIIARKLTTNFPNICKFPFTTFPAVISTVESYAAIKSKAVRVKEVTLGNKCMKGSLVLKVNPLTIKVKLI